ncbi:uncharacterized protein LOC110464713 isoform X1 [Mizuhopecten yessoensis]|uniref:uncharacterized protein LOC110464713 isoform X1 n=1 Tax=Mizuhopecten yessoensis TaxID=6573 RepID=UPI000B45D2B5|nr:uncharacterized protein LOC110464713 isoform X1 [Mizuhopecten yessoensis]
MMLCQEMSGPATHSAYPTVSLVDKLRLAACNGQVDKVQELIQLGATFHPDKEGRTPLHFAAVKGFDEVCKFLVSHGCPLDEQDSMGYTAIHRAASQGHMEVIRHLLEEGGSADRQDEHGNTALHEAAWNGYSSAIELLIKHNCNVVVTNKAGFTSLHLAAQNGHNQSTRVLLYGGCNPDLKNNYGDSSIHTAARYGHAGVTRILISARCCLNLQNKNGDTALHIAAALKRRKIAKLLVEAGIDLYIKNKQTETATDVARRKEHPEIILIITSFSRSKTPKSQKEVNFKDMPVNVMDGPVVVPDEDAPIKTDKSSKEKSKFFFFKKKKKDKDKMDDGKTGTRQGQQMTQAEKDKVQGFFSQYIPRPGSQYYRDLAGNIKQGPIGYTPLCQCGPALHKLEQHVNTNSDNIYEHIDASNQVLHQRLEQLDKRTAQQVFAIDKLTKERLTREEKNCNGRISQQLQQERKFMLQKYTEQTRMEVEDWLEAKLSSYGHCLNHHHDDSALPSKSFFTDVHENENGRLFRSRSDETLSQSDYSVKHKKRQFYESRQAAMQQLREWQDDVKEGKARHNERVARENNLGKGQIYSSQGHVQVGQIQVHSAPQGDSSREENVRGSRVTFNLLSPSTASTSRTPFVQSPADSNDIKMFGSQGAIPKRIPHSQTWHNSEQFRNSPVKRESSPLTHSTPKSYDSSPYEMVGGVKRGAMVRSQTTDPDGFQRSSQRYNQHHHVDPSYQRSSQRESSSTSRPNQTDSSDGFHRTRQRQSFPERGSSNTSTGNNPISTSSGAGQDPLGSQQSSIGIGKGNISKPTFSTFGYPEMDTKTETRSSSVVDNMVGPSANSGSDEPQQPGSRAKDKGMCGSGVKEINPYGSVSVVPDSVYGHSRTNPSLRQVPKPPEKPDFLRKENMCKERDMYGYFVKNKDDMYMSMQPKVSPLRQRTRSSDELLLEENEITSAHEMAKRGGSADRTTVGQRSMNPTPHNVDGRSSSAQNTNYVSNSQGHSTQGQSDQGQGQWSFYVGRGQGKTGHQTPVGQQDGPVPASYGQYSSRVLRTPESHYVSMNDDHYRMTPIGEKNRINSGRTPMENPYVSGKEIAKYRRGDTSPAPYHSTYNMNRVGHNDDYDLIENVDKSKSKSESNLLDRTSGSSNCGNSPRGDFLVCRTPVSGGEEADKDHIRNVSNYPNAYCKEDSSSNPDSGYSSKIFGNRLRPGNVPSNSGSPSFNSGTPSSSFSTDHSISTPGHSHSNSPYIPANHADYQQIPGSQDQHREAIESQVQNWYQKKLIEAADKIKDPSCGPSPPIPYPGQAPNRNLYTSHQQLGQTSQTHPHYGSQPQYSNKSYYRGNSAYGNRQQIASYVQGSDV